MTCAEFAARLGVAAGHASSLLSVPTEEFMKAVEEKAKSAIGTYEYGWPQLAEFTQEDRVGRGFSANDPLLRTGEMREGIKSMALPIGLGAEGLVFSGEKKALWAEMGTAGGASGGGWGGPEPPRSFLMQSLVRSPAKMAEIFGKFAEEIFVE